MSGLLVAAVAWLLILAASGWAIRVDPDRKARQR